jgi:hypothetical protein
MTDSCEHSNEPTGSIKSSEIIEKLHNWWLLKKDSAPWSFSWLFSQFGALRSFEILLVSTVLHGVISQEIIILKTKMI